VTTQTAVPAPTHATRRRAFFGLFDADGWGWAIAKSLFWFVVIIMMLGYIPDRAYYFTVQKTVDIGLLAWSPVNLCPPANETLPCPAPAGATLPWQPAPNEISLPAPRSDGAAAFLGSTYVFAGGTDGTSPKADVYYSRAVGTGNLDKWSVGPALPEARADAAVTVIGSTIYVIGGYGPDGKPTSTAYSLTVANDGSLPATWTTEAAIVLPAPRAGASAVAVADGIILMGGTDGTAPTRSVWKSQVDKTGKFLGWKDQQPLFEENVDGVATRVGDVVFLMGGKNAKGETVATVQQGHVGGPHTTTIDLNAIVDPWAVSAQTNLPFARTNMSGFTANGTIYIQGGSDGTGPRAETLWAIPDANGIIPRWNNLPQTDLGTGLAGSAAVNAGSYGFLFGGLTSSGSTAGIARTYLAPQPPFFQLGLLGATLPALKLDGEVGQQIGYLNAATVGAINFIILIFVGWAFNHKPRVQAFIDKRRRKRR
jgi:hypothetical protein